MIAFYRPIPGYDLFNELPESMSSGMIHPMTINHFTLFGYQILGMYLKDLLPDQNMIPEYVLLNDTESDFDYHYWNQILTKPESFMDLMKIMSLEFNYGPNCLNIIWTKSDYQTEVSVTESLGNFITAMYGVDVKYINQLEDIYEPDSFSPELSQFSPEGIYRMTQDMIKYERMLGVTYPDD